jgi:hypothetical protein
MSMEPLIGRILEPDVMVIDELEGAKNGILSHGLARIARTTINRLKRVRNA